MKSPLQFFKAYSIEKKRDTSCIIVDKKTQQRYLQREIIPNKITQLELEKRRTLTHPYLLSLEEFDRENVIYQYGQRTLREYLQLRNGMNQSLKEQQLWGIILGVTGAAAYLQKQEIAYPTMCLSDILITHDNKAKLMDPCMKSNVGQYQAPEYFCSAVDKYPFKAGVFSLGVCILQCGLGVNMKDCYVNKYIDFDKLQSKIDAMSAFYSQVLINIIVRMLDEDPDTRPDWINLADILNLMTWNSEPKFIRHVVQPLQIDCEDQFNQFRSVQPIETQNPDVLQQFEDTLLFTSPKQTKQSITNTTRHNTFEESNMKTSRRLDQEIQVTPYDLKESNYNQLQQMQLFTDPQLLRQLRQQISRM